MKVGIVYQPLGTMPLPIGGAGSIAMLTYETARLLAKSCEVFVYSRSVKVPGSSRADEGVLYQWIPVSLDEKVYRQFTNHPRVASRLLGLRKPTRPFFSSGIHNLEYGLRVARDLRARNCDVVHIHNYSQLVYPVRALNPRAKIVLHMHCEWLNQLDRKMIQRRLAKVNSIIGCSEYITGKIREAFPQFASCCRTIYNGADTTIFSPNGHSISPHDTRKQILFLGRLVPEKGPHVLLQAFRMLVETHPDTQLVMVGPGGLTDREFVLSLSSDPRVTNLSTHYDGDYQAKLKNLATPELRERISYVGNVPHPSQAEYYKRATIVVCPSVWNDPFPLIIPEAMAAGAAVVATRSGGIPEILEHEKTGLLVERDDPSSLAKAMIRLLEDEPLRKSLGQAARQRVLQSYTWDTIAQNLLKHYTALMADGKRAQA